VACAKDKRDFDNLNGGKIEVIGHGGGGFQNLNNPLPSNSLASINRGLGSDADALELDIRFSADSVPILFHDAQLMLATNCEGCVESRFSNEIIGCDYRQGLLAGLSGEKVVGLDQALSHLASLNIFPPIYLDVHLDKACAESEGQATFDAASALWKSLESSPDGQHVSVICLDADFLSDLGELLPSSRLYWEAPLASPEIAEANARGFFGLVRDMDDAEKPQVTAAHDAGLHVILFAPFDQWSHNDAFDMHPDGVITDNVRLMRNLLD
jgi:glycerophosphoryl diester phosphodiesterase